MDVRQLRYLAAVVEEGTVTGAAARLHMTQPPLTAQLHALEAEAGCPLFLREGRRLRLTEAGQTLYLRARTILGLCDAAQEEMDAYRAGTAGTLRLGVVSSVRGLLLARWLHGFSAAHPAVRYDISGENTYQQLALTESGQRDIAIVRTPFPASKLTVLPLRREQMLAAASPVYFSAAETQPVTLTSLAKQPLVVYRRWEEVLRSRMEAVGCAPRIRCRCDDAQTTLSLAAAGLGIGLIPASAAAAERENNLIFRAVADEGLATEIVAVCRAPQQLPQSAQAFWKYLEEWAAAENPDGEKEK